MRIHWLPKLLSKVHQGILQIGKAPSQSHKKGSHMEMDQNRTNGIRNTQGSGSKRTSTESKMRRQKTPPSGILLRILLHNRTKLQRLRSRITSSRKSLMTMEDLSTWITASNCDIHRPLQSTILERTTKNQPKGGKRIP